MVFCSGSTTFWRDLANTPSSLKILADQIPESLLRDKAPSTVRNYLSAFRRWSIWASRAQLQPFPASAAHVALYLVFLAQSGSGRASITQTLAALRWMHVKADQVDPSVHPVIGQLKAALLRLLSRPTDRRLPLLPHQYSRIMSALNQRPLSLADSQLAALVGLGFAALLRWDDLSRLKAKDLQISPSREVF